MLGRTLALKGSEIFKEKELSVTKNRDVREQKRKKRKGGRKKGCETVGEEPDLKS